MISPERTSVVLLTRFRLPAIVAEFASRRAAGKTVFYDLYGTLHGPIFLLLVTLLGRRRLEALIAALARLLRLPLRAVPHGQRIPKYAGIQMGASIDAMYFLERLWRDPQYRPRGPLLPALDRTESVSLYLKFVGIQVWQLVENVRVLKLTQSGPITIRANHRIWPDRFLEHLAHCEGVRIVDDGVGLLRLDVLSAAVLALGWLASALVRWRPARPTMAREHYTVATEILDPNTLHGRPAEPNYLIGPALAPREVLFYVQPDRRRFFPRILTGLLPGSRVVDLGRLRLASSDVAFLARSYWAVLRAAVQDGMPSLVVLTHLSYVRKYASLATLFKQFSIDVHVYNAYPQGRVPWRHDSGLVTAVCRRYGVHSLSYQTRAHMGRAVEYCFDCFDTYCLWGDWWRETYRDYLAVGNLPLIGDVFLDGYDRTRAPASGARQETIVLFPCDIHYDEPSYLTLDFGIDFLVEVAKAVGRLNGRRDAPNYRVVVKPKHPEHAAVFARDSRLSAVLREQNLQFEYLTCQIHDVAEAVSMADYAVSVLPTTPGIDVLLMGTPSAYFNAFDRGADKRFAEHPMIVRNSDEIEGFLCGRRGLDRAFVDSLDPWRDGASRARLCEVIKQIVELVPNETAVGRDAVKLSA